MTGGALVNPTTVATALVAVGAYAPEMVTGDLRVAILPLRADAPIYLAASSRPNFRGAGSVVALQGLEIIPRYTVQLTAP